MQEDSGQAHDMGQQEQTDKQDRGDSEQHRETDIQTSKQQNCEEDKETVEHAEQQQNTEEDVQQDSNGTGRDEHPLSDDDDGGDDGDGDDNEYSKRAAAESLISQLSTAKLWHRAYNIDHQTIVSVYALFYSSNAVFTHFYCFLQALRSQE